MLPGVLYRNDIPREEIVDIAGLPPPQRRPGIVLEERFRNLVKQEDVAATSTAVGPKARDIVRPWYPQKCHAIEHITVTYLKSYSNNSWLKVSIITTRTVQDEVLSKISELRRTLDFESRSFDKLRQYKKDLEEESLYYKD